MGAPDPAGAHTASSARADLPRLYRWKEIRPPEDCGGAAAFQQQQDDAPWRAQELLDQIADCVRERDHTALRDLAEEIPTLQIWLTLSQFDRWEVNRQLRQYARKETR